MEGIDPAAIPFGELIEAQRPVVLAEVAADWPLTRAGRAGAREAAHYLQRYASDAPVTVFHIPSESGGRLHYAAGGTALNFTTSRGDLGQTLADMLETGDGEALYVGSADIERFVPGLATENGLDLEHPDFRHREPIKSIWIGNRTVVPAHYDTSNNLACCTVGRRRFTLFPPDQIANLYPGPLDLTPAGQVVSMVDFDEPDHAAHPGFREALAVSQVAELKPGDVLFYPALWWHRVEALDPFNVMMNYWWNPVPTFVDTPETTVLHAILSLRDRPETEKRAWQAVFDYYVFGDARRAAEHLPPEARGLLGPLDEMAARRLRARILHRMNR
ncbi:cupin-like domain-containing protein [Aurantiacibacter spongiae]|uniref:Cupin-like domain-containing protein n=2 Tax=Aurantiacibacter spongiae TaxID=2488860 RepID=A0A3N5DPG2_9SPHN|nr:cupin-like domain-containing protein [Aurantiacibacter spongiae]